jgi:beta-xylosidase
MMMKKDYKNPIINADYSDPDVIHVGDTYYMTASSFNYTPGLPILISKDLVNWELKNYAIKNIDYPMYTKPAHAKGVWAPAIRYYNDYFWIFYGMPDEGIFMIKTKNPLGEWSQPYLLLEGKGYIDPCPFWDGDRAYLIHGYAKSRIGFKSYLGIFEMSLDATRVLSDDVFLYDGTKTQETIEGPKVYKRGEYYYIFAPAGGVTYGWQTVLRSKEIMGPYEEKIVLQQGSTPVNGPHQGGWVEAEEGSHWFVHFQDRGIYGRVVHLQPMQWEDDWPIIGNAGQPVLSYQIPVEKTDGINDLATSDDFSKEELGLQWQWFGNHTSEFFQLEASRKTLRLNCLNGPNLWETPNILTQKFMYDRFDVEIEMDYNRLEIGSQAGCVVLGGQYTYLAIKKEESGFKLLHGISTGTGASREEHIVESIEIHQTSEKIHLYLSLDQEEGINQIKMAYAYQGIQKTACKTLFTPSDDTWVGSKIGLYAIGNAGSADFNYIKVVSKDHD